MNKQNDTVPATPVADHEPSLLPAGIDFRLVWNDEFDGTELDCKRSSGGLKYPVTKAAVARDGWLYASCSSCDGPTRILVFDIPQRELKPVGEAAEAK